MRDPYTEGVVKEYVEKRNGGYYIAGTRVSLDSVVYAFLRGESPEGIAESFPALQLEEIFGALTFYLANRAEVDRYLSEGRREFDKLRQQARQDHPALYAKIEAARRKSHTPGSRGRGSRADADFNYKIVAPSPEGTSRRYSQCS